jgi:lysosomal Pro-X carboxypeptidase
VLAEKFAGAVIFIEERYYGQSVPTSLRPGEAYYSYSNSQQVVADYALAVGALRRQFNSSRVVAVGGSYGGMLAAWLRKQHPVSTQSLEPGASRAVCY